MPRPRISGLAAALLCLAPVAEAGGPVCAPLDLPVSRLDPPPSQYADFCARHPEACALTGPAVLEWTAALHDLLALVNRQVNDDTVLVPDWDRLGVEEDWSFPDGCAGDCEDFGLEKRRRLVALGVPGAALTMAIVLHRQELFAHAVLLAETGAGTWVLDNLDDAVLCWDAVPYRFLRRERPDGLWTRYATPTPEARQ